MKNSRTKYTLLGMLAIKDFSGYGITQFIKMSTNYFWSESEGQIYPALAQCVEEGLATCKEYESTKNNRPKKIYSITPKGKKELQSWLEENVQPTLIRNELLLKLFFGTNTDLLNNIHLVLVRKKEVELELKHFQQVWNELSVKHTKSKHLIYWQITLDNGIKTAKAELNWINNTLKVLQQKLSGKKSKIVKKKNKQA